VFKFIVPVSDLSAISAESSFAWAINSPSYQNLAEYGTPLTVVILLQAVRPPKAISSDLMEWIE
jgi:hypothetical protein